MYFIFASNNVHKLTEIRKCIPAGFTIESINEIGIAQPIPETGYTLRQNALKKACYVYERASGFSLADDSGLEITALGGRPGVYSARYAGPNATDAQNIARVLAEMKGVENRHAIFRTVFAVIINKVTLFFEGAVEGTISHEPAGSNGFGYDPIFIPKGYDRTFAQMTAEEKAAISHRSMACRQFHKFLTAFNKTA